LNNSIPGDEIDAGVTALGQNGEKLSDFALKMTPMKKVELYFPSGVQDDSLHIIVQVSDCKSCGQSYPLTKALTRFSV
jgi:hypothetical protein